MTLTPDGWERLKARPPHLSLADIMDRSEPDTNGGCWLWARAMFRDGYGNVGSKIGGHNYNWAAHRAAWIAAHGPIPDGMMVLHRCDVKICVNPAHLFLGTGTDNMRDMVTKGRHRSIGGNHSPTSTAVRAEIRRLGTAGVPKRRIAREVGVAPVTVRRWLSLALNPEGDKG